MSNKSAWCIHGTAHVLHLHFKSMYDTKKEKKKMSRWSVSGCDGCVESSCRASSSPSVITLKPWLIQGFLSDSIWLAYQYDSEWLVYEEEGKALLLPPCPEPESLVLTFSWFLTLEEEAGCNANKSFQGLLLPCIYYVHWEGTATGAM